MGKIKIYSKYSDGRMNHIQDNEVAFMVYGVFVLYVVLCILMINGLPIIYCA